ncbi:MAG: glycosyltransferase family 2 protein [Weeksellaceae bacterium]
MISASIIIPAYRRIDQTLKTIDLILHSKGINTDFNLEIIVSDASEDEKLHVEIIKTFADKIIYTRPSRPGIAANKNHGASIATHPILIFCDSDMEVESQTILNTLKFLQTHDRAAAVGGPVIWKGGPRAGSNDKPRAEDRMITEYETTFIEAIYSRYIATYKEAFDAVGGYDETVFNMRGEGSDLSIRYWRAGFPLAFSQDLTVHHVHDVEGGIIRNVPHPEYGIAKDMLLLAYKYNMTDGEDKNFQKTVAANFKSFGEDGYTRILEGILYYYDFITSVKPILDKQRQNLKGIYDFKFLEIFTDKTLYTQVLDESQKRLESARSQSFHK